MKIKQWTSSLPAKVIAFFLLVLMACITAGCVLGGTVLINEDFYTQSIDDIKEDFFSPFVRSASYTILNDVLNGDPQSALTYAEENNLSAEILDESGERLWSNYDGTQATWEFTTDYSQGNYYGIEIPADETYTVQIYLNDSFTEQSELSFLNTLINIGFALRYWIYAIGVLALTLMIVSFIFLLSSAGHKAGREEITATGLVKVPFDLLTAALALAVCAVGYCYYDFSLYNYNDIVFLVFLVVCFVAAVCVGTAYCMNFAVRVKLGGWWKNTVIYWLGRQLTRICKAVWRGFASLVRNLPLIWKTGVFLLIITLLELIVIFMFYWEVDILVVLWEIKSVIVILAVLYLALVLRKLQKGSEALAQGDLSYQVDTRRMLWDFKRHGENLNSIGGGMTRAVDDRLKSERLKTELITNVSHDIKTPLTSIINYSNLICKEHTENEKVTEYAAVLLRQSERLRKLIDDLVEASKASTGNVDVLLAPCEVGVLLTQTAGEYEQRLRENGLELITKQPEIPVRIMADGRHLWRVFDNLMNNICKYAQNGTRVYLGVEEKNGEAVISFKNTSKYPLDISTEELMERFVRGDSSRSTDGNGLGLSIAQSLTELQNGKLELTIDGDLFKVVLRFNCIFRVC